jgi:hypothetical protein
MLKKRLDKPNPIRAGGLSLGLYRVRAQPLAALRRCAVRLSRLLRGKTTHCGLLDSMRQIIGLENIVLTLPLFPSILGQ